MFNDLLLYVLQLHVDLFIILYSFESLVKCLLQLFKIAVWMVLNVVFTPFKDIILESKTKHVDDVSLHCFTINFNGLLEYFDVSMIRINVLGIIAFCMATWSLALKHVTLKVVDTMVV
jgi:hypothetical protein